MNKATGGALAWTSITQYFVVEELVRRTWELPYSRRTNFISDLGARDCGTYKGREVCSPEHAWMNTSFGLVGTAMVAGAALLRSARPDLLSRPVLVLYATGGAGSVLVGLFPEDTVGGLHVLGAGAFFVGANLGHLLLASRLWRRRFHRSYAAVLGAVGVAGLAGTALIVAGQSRGLGDGFVERIVVYGADLGFIVSGLLLLGSARRTS